jgi:DNA-binding GntR family transcriptional regulator
VFIHAPESVGLEETKETIMMVDHDADRPLYRQLADVIRDQIQRGELKPGQRVPSIPHYVDKHSISRDTVQRAIALLRGEGLIVTTRWGTHVRRPAQPVTVHVGGGDRIFSRVPTEPERRAMGIDEGVPVIIVERQGQDPAIYPADQTIISTWNEADAAGERHGECPNDAERSDGGKGESAGGDARPR